MLTQLPTIKSRLTIPADDPTFDILLTNAIAAVSTRFDTETYRTLARTANATHEFPADATEIPVPCYPIETVTKFELKTSESSGWQQINPAPDYLLRDSCIISLSLPLVYQLSTPQPSTPAARVTYTGGFVLPGTIPTPGQTPLPADFEQAAVEQVAFWYQTRDKLGIDTTWPHGGTYEKLATHDLLPSVQAILKRHERWSP